MFTGSGHEVSTAADAREALELYAEKQFDVVISDLGLPDRSGLELMREIQKLRPIRAIALSGYGMEDDMRETRAAGFSAHLVKPVDFEQLSRLLDEMPDAS